MSTNWHILCLIFEKIMKNYIFIFYFLLSSIATSQNYVFELNTKKAIKATHILFNLNNGLITNHDGYFDLPNNIFIDTLYFSHLLYKSRKLLSNELKKNDTIFLEKAPIQLDEIILNSFNPKEIVIKSIHRIDKNYINTPHNLFGFFRQTLKENSEGIEMIEVEFISYTKNKRTTTKILKAKLAENYSKWSLKTYGGVSDMIKDGDFVRKKAHFLDLNNINDYDFIFKEKIEYKNLEVYKINFTPTNDDNLQNLRKGTLYIDSDSYAIVEIRYTFDKTKLLRLTNEQSKTKDNTTKPAYVLKSVENTIKYYQLPNKKWCLFYLEVHNLLEGTYQNKKYNYNLAAKLIINDIKIKNAYKVKTNYNLTRTFSKALIKINDLKNWNDTYKFSLSNEEKEILIDIDKKKL
jgi:hypothetical protein